MTLFKLCNTKKTSNAFLQDTKAEMSNSIINFLVSEEILYFVCRQSLSDGN